MAILKDKLTVVTDTQQIVERVANEAKPQDHILIMSNGGFDQCHQRLLNELAQRETV